VDSQLARNCGLGTRVHAAFENYALEHRALRFLVLEENSGAHRFWLKLGYRDEKTSPKIVVSAMLGTAHGIRRRLVQ
jgi:GNAT superfamily N-acetyltransferase